MDPPPPPQFEQTLSDGLETSVVSSIEISLDEVRAQSGNEYFGRWWALMKPKHPVGADDDEEPHFGFLRLSVAVLHGIEEPKVHLPNELADGRELNNPRRILGFPNVSLVAHLLRFKIWSVELAPYGISRPECVVQLSYGDSSIKTRRSSPSYQVDFHEMLEVPVFTPTLLDTIRLEVIDLGGSGAEVLASLTFSFAALKLEPLVEKQWISMYGPRPRPPTATGRFQRALDAPPGADRSAYRGRVLLCASADFWTAESAAPRPGSWPLVGGGIQNAPGSGGGGGGRGGRGGGILRRETAYILRCDVLEASGFPIGWLDSVYVIVSFGDVERRSALRRPIGGSVRFESPLSGRESYYEQLGEVQAKLPIDWSQHYDVFVHVYVAAPLGDRRIAYKRYTTRELSSSGPHAPPHWAMLKADPASSSNHEDALLGAMIQLSLSFGAAREMAGARRPHIRIPKAKPWELRARIMQAQGLVSEDVNGLSDPYVSVSLAGVTATTRVVEKTLNPIFFEEVRPESAQSRAQSRAQS